ncbi:hypothetical protein TNCT_318881 [Trichonephila clavata]|uniref:Uncharacterized protein n=1 Tax=Trichonephila clavata TaxID=2740835 RepID=A0A8X6JJJ0_TRICU|nr:hypothetical protein TNCT_318881 [Trichonephila clavata]
MYSQIKKYASPKKASLPKKKKHNFPKPSTFIPASENQTTCISATKRALKKTKNRWKESTDIEIKIEPHKSHENESDEESSDEDMSDEDTLVCVCI